jgi:hypothetical protein
MVTFCTKSIDKEMTSVNKKYLGEWNIVEMERWDRDYIDLVVPGFISIGDDGLGSFRFGVVEAEIDYRIESNVGTDRLEFSFEGVDEGNPVSGRGWARVIGNTMNGLSFA